MRTAKPENRNWGQRERETLRRRFLPSEVRLLFVGESPPASGRFFYRGDSGLYRAIRDAFLNVDASITDAGFLAAFQAQGCYLVDLCLDPVDNLTPQLRRAACIDGEATLAKTLRKLKPRSIVTMVRSIEPNVERAMARVEWRGPILRLPYPGRWSRHRDIFVESLAATLPALLSSPPMPEA